MIPNNKKVNTEQETQNNNISNKQDKLTAGDNITITDNTISSNVEFLDYTTLSIPSNWQWFGEQRLFKISFWLDTY